MANKKKETNQTIIVLFGILALFLLAIIFTFSSNDNSDSNYNPNNYVPPNSYNSDSGAKTETISVSGGWRNNNYNKS